MNIAVKFFTTLVWTSVIKGERINPFMPNERIINGDSAFPGDYTFMAYINIVAYENKVRIEGTCAGSIVSDTFILSAAHCFKK